MLGIAPIMLLLARVLGGDLGGVSDAQLVSVLRQLALEPQHVSARLHSHFTARRHRRVKLIHLPARVT